MPNKYYSSKPTSLRYHLMFGNVVSCMGIRWATALHKMIIAMKFDDRQTVYTSVDRKTTSIKRIK